MAVAWKQIQSKTESSTKVETPNFVEVKAGTKTATPTQPLPKGGEIVVYVDSNEQTHPRAAILEKVVSEHADKFQYAGLAEIPVDVCFVHSDGRRYHVELKEVADLISSVVSGHLAKQLTALQELNEPGCIIVTGNVAQLETAQPYKLGRAAISRNLGMTRHFVATATNNGYPVLFLGNSWAEYALALAQEHFARTIIQDGLKKEKPAQIGMLTMVPGVGSTLALGLMQHFGSIRAIMEADEETIAAVMVNGRKVGKKAKAIYQTFR